MSRLLLVTAHPDDECFAFGGIVALAARAGWDIHLLCFTQGTAGSYRGDALTPEELGRIRSDELAASCRILGIRAWEVLNYPDGRLEFAGFHECAGLVVERIRRFRPDAVLTFGQDGSLNVHNDHTLVSCWTTAAYRWAARAKRYPEQSLQPHTAARLIHQSTNFTMPDRAPLLPAPWSVQLDISSVKDTKERAFLAHTTQVPVFEKVKPLWEQHRHEYYFIAGQAEPGEVRPGTDLAALLG